MSKKKIPINRVNKFFSAEDFNLEVELGREYIEGDINMTVVLYQVNREESDTDDIYGEAEKDGIRFKIPVELSVIVLFNEPENKTYNQGVGSLRYLQDGQLKFGVYDSQLKEMDAEITYGDYIGYAVSETEMRYFSVVNDGKKNYDNAHTILGFKGAFRTILCAPVDEEEFTGI
jgi:hypothetical protein